MSESFDNKEIIIYTLGTLGDVLPFVYLAQELKSRRFRVTILTCEKFRSHVSHFDLHFVPIADISAYEIVYGNAALWSNRPEGMRLAYEEFYGPSIIPTVEFIKTRFEKNKELVVVGWGAENGAAMLCKQLGIDYIGIFLAPHAIRSCIAPNFPLSEIKYPRLFRRIKLRHLYKTEDRIWWENVMRDAVTKACMELGLQAPATLDDFRALGSAKKLIGLFPEWFCQYQSDWPMQLELTDFPLKTNSPAPEFRAVFDAFHSRNGAPIVFTPGTGVMSIEGYFDVAAEVSAELNLPAIFLSPLLRNGVYETNDRILCVNFAEMRYLLERSKVIVHHGGIGTCAEALRAKIPQLICARAFDQFDNGHRISKLKLGIMLPYSQYSPDFIGREIEKLLRNRPPAQVAWPEKKPNTDPAWVQAGDIIESCLRV